MELTSSLDFVVINKKNVPTFRRGQYSSSIDVTIASKKVTKKIADWQVLDTEKTSATTMTS